MHVAALLSTREINLRYLSKFQLRVALLISLSTLIFDSTIFILSCFRLVFDDFAINNL